MAYKKTTILEQNILQHVINMHAKVIEIGPKSNSWLYSLFSGGGSIKLKICNDSLNVS